EEGTCDLSGAKPVCDAQRERDLRGTREGRMAAEEDQAQLVIELRRRGVGDANVGLREGHAPPLVAKRVDDRIFSDTEEPSLELRAGSAVGPPLERTEARVLNCALNERELVHSKLAHEPSDQPPTSSSKRAFDNGRCCISRIQDDPPLPVRAPRRNRSAVRAPDICARWLSPPRACPLRR